MFCHPGEPSTSLPLSTGSASPERLAKGLAKDLSRDSSPHSVDELPNSLLELTYWVKAQNDTATIY